MTDTLPLPSATYLPAWTLESYRTKQSERIGTHSHTILNLLHDLTS